MKVLSYLELACRTHHIYKEYEIWLCLNVPYNWELSIRDFYSQTFKPELITELFEGWDSRDFTDVIDYFQEHSVIQFDKIYYTKEYTIGKDNELEFDVFLYPRTLDDFITDCQRSGIELTWKAND